MKAHGILTISFLLSIHGIQSQNHILRFFILLISITASPIPFIVLHTRNQTRYGMTLEDSQVWEIYSSKRRCWTILSDPCSCPSQKSIRRCIIIEIPRTAELEPPFNMKDYRHSVFTVGGLVTSFLYVTYSRILLRVQDCHKEITYTRTL